jgi:hypothetical protein
MPYACLMKGTTIMLPEGLYAQVRMEARRRGVSRHSGVHVQPLTAKGSARVAPGRATRGSVEWSPIEPERGSFPASPSTTTVAWSLHAMSKHGVTPGRRLRSRPVGGRHAQAVSGARTASRCASVQDVPPIATETTSRTEKGGQVDGRAKGGAGGGGVDAEGGRCSRRGQGATRPPLPIVLPTNLDRG